jgi:hypothetical protein
VLRDGLRSGSLEAALPAVAELSFDGG